jgi:hypothetical protein
MKHCHICNAPILTKDAHPYVIGEVRAHFCPKHASSLECAVTLWVRRAMDQLARERADAEEADRLRVEREVASSLAREVANDRMALLAAEGLPLATRREMRTKGRAA